MPLDGIMHMYNLFRWGHA